MITEVKKIRVAVPSGKVRDRSGYTHECTHLECKVYYSKGGYNNWTSTMEGRGYYISLSPVTIGDHFVTYVAFSGCKKLVVPCNRAGKKLAEKAAAMFDAEVAGLAELAYPNNGIDFSAKENAA